MDWMIPICLLGLLSMFVLLCIAGERARAEQHDKDVKAIEQCNCSEEVKQQMYAALFRHEADGDLH